MNVVILGDGLLATELIEQTGWDHISRKKDNFDITDNSLFHNFFIENFESAAYWVKYNVIINCIANTDTYSSDKKTHWDVNYAAVVNLANFCEQWNIKLVHISTDYVYAANTNIPSESDIPLYNNNWYSYTKLLGDCYVQLNRNNLVCRGTHKPMPWPYDTVWSDISGNFDYVNIIAGIIIKLVKHHRTGLYNIGTQTKTLYDLSKRTKPDILISNKFKHETTPMNTEMDLTKLNVTNLIIDLDLIINDVIKLFKTDNCNYSIINKENLINAFMHVYSCNYEISSLLVDSIINLTINDLIIGKMHYTKKENQSLVQFRDNEIELRIAAEQRAKHKNLIDSYLKTIAGKIDTNITIPRLTNLNCFSAYIDRLITERIKHYNFKLDDRHDESTHQELLCKYIHDDMIYMLIDIKSNGYFYIGEKRTFDEPKLIEYLKAAK